MSGNGTAATLSSDQARRLFGEIEAPVIGRAGQSVVPSGHRWIRLPIDVYEIPDALVVKAFVPEAHLSELDVTIGADGLRITGGLGWAGVDETHRMTWHRCEIGAVRFAETVALPIPVDAERATATYEAGVLAIVVPKATQPATKRIRVRSQQSVVDLG